MKGSFNKFLDAVVRCVTPLVTSKWTGQFVIITDMSKGRVMKVQLQRKENVALNEEDT